MLSVRLAKDVPDSPRPKKRLGTSYPKDNRRKKIKI